jgi:hypothetical protein
MYISIADDLKKQFHAACALRGLKMSQVVAELIEQWGKAHDTSLSEVSAHGVKDKVVKSLLKSCNS